MPDEMMEFDVGVVGLGYVGMTIATVLADVGQKVLGVELRPDVVAMTKAGEPHFVESGLKDMLGDVLRSGHLTVSHEFAPDSHCDIYLISVGTPLDEDGKARLDFIRKATQQVADNMRDGALVILRSTVKIGTTRDVVAPILAATGKTFDIAMCPERTLEGRALQELRKLPQIVGADTEAARERAARFFRHLTDTVIGVSTLETAEIVKLVDNTYRDVQFGFANEVARICDAYGVNAMEVINGGKLGYPRTNVALPGLVGGPCLEKDPHILSQSLIERGVELDITRAARRTNERQPSETVTMFMAEHARRHGSDVGPLITIAGIAFKGIPETDDLRGSMAVRVINEILRQQPKARLRLYDPIVPADALTALFAQAEICSSLDQAVDQADILVITNNHPSLAANYPGHMVRQMAPNGFIYDYWNHFSDLRKPEDRLNYFSTGNFGNGRRVAL
jgi:UDP-N-acetyl-D-mannosaminuronic acid dehydrogenase